MPLQEFTYCGTAKAVYIRRVFTSADILCLSFVPLHALQESLAVEELLTGLVPYGFSLQHRGVFLKLQVCPRKSSHNLIEWLQEDVPNIVDCPDPDHMTPHERRIGRLASEEASFSENHYL